MDARDIALTILLDMDINNTFSNIATDKALRRHQFDDKKDRAFVTRLAEGTTECRINLDYIIDCYSKTKIKKCKPLIRCLLRMGTYQIMYMDSVPDSAATNEAVRLAKKHGFSTLSGFVNGVLRTISANKNNIVYPDRDKNLTGYLSVRYSVPEWLVAKITHDYPDCAEKILADGYAGRDTTIRVNTDKTTPDELKVLLADSGISVSDGHYADKALHISGYDFIRRVAGYRQGLFTVQDESSMCAIKAADISEGDIVFDVCAAPGGKTTAAAEYLHGTGFVYSMDIAENKLELIEENVSRLGLDNVKVFLHDATTPISPELTDGHTMADVVLADLPCSGLGVMGRKNDIKYRVTMEGMRELVTLQRNILNAISKYVKKGGTLLYSTCTINPDENENNVRWFLDNHSEYALVEKRLFLQGVDDCDGFFFAVLKRKSNDIKSMYMSELGEWVRSIGEPAFRAGQIYEWLHKKYVASPDEMTNLPKLLRQKIAADGFVALSEETRQESLRDGTIKFLFRLGDGQMIETVFMRHNYGNSVCISSQAGCRMGCRFCASTIGGLVRNLTASEMLEQVYAAMRLTGERVSNIVVMGTGEPLDNYDNLVRFIRLISDEKGYNISQRNITVSSCGIVPKIYELADCGFSITFALSLHAPTDEERRELMPIAHRYSLEETLAACRAYFERTGRRVTFEYSLVKGKNDTVWHADKLAELLCGFNCHVNLIPVNPVAECEFEQSDSDSVQKFKLALEKKSINGTIRKSMGSDIDAACGQLRRKYSVSGGDR